jgi:predicted RNase H-like HicB family nuclease
MTAAVALDEREGFVKLRVVLEPSELGGFTAVVPALPGCVSEGETRDEALANIREAIQLCLEPLEEDSVLGPGAEIIEITV